MIYVLGSINTDLVTRIERFPTGGETLEGSNPEVLPGGKGANQALAAKRSGADVCMVGAVGSDVFADPAISNLRTDGVNLENIRRTETPTGVAMIMVDNAGENAIIVTPGANKQVSASQLDEVDYGIGDVLVTQHEIKLREVWRAHEKASELGVTIVHNAAPAQAISQEALARIDYLIVNESEAVILASNFRPDVTDASQAALLLQEKSGKNVILTIGERGCVALTADTRIARAALPVEVVDTTGAGDSFVGAFAAALSKGLAFESALDCGIVAGGLACRKLGAQSAIPHSGEITEGLKALRNQSS